MTANTKRMNKQAFSIIQMPVHDTPVFKEKQGKEWVSYGAKDEYATYLEQLYMGSSIHSAIVNGVAAMIYGEGLDATDRDTDDGTKEQWLRLQKLLAASDDDLLKKLSMDLKMYGMCYVNTIWNTSRSKIACMKHLPVHCIRAGVADEDGKVNLYYYKRDWKDNQVPDAIKAFCSEDRVEASRVLQIKRYTPSFHYYGTPDYVGSTGYIELDNKIQTFHLNNIKNGLFPSMMVNFNNGVPTEEEQRMIEAKVNDKFGGAEAAGKVLITFNDGTDTQPTFTPVQNNGTDGMYEYLSGESSSKILSGHRVTSPLLFGVRGDGTGFGNNADELRDSYSLFHHTVIIPFQSILLEGLAPVFDTNNISLNLYFEPLKPADFINIGEAEAASESEAVEASQDCCHMSEAMDDEAVADWLILRGEEPDDKLYEMVDSRQVDYDMEAAHDALWEFAKAIPSRPGAKDDQDNPLIKIRYRYAPNSVSANSREFCKKMVAANKIYRKRDIELAGEQAVNPGFGEGGADTYSCWLYKGGPRCHHFWQRETYLQKGGKITIREARALINKIPPNERPKYRIPQNDVKVAKMPNDMPRKGFSPNNPNLPSDAR